MVLGCLTLEGINKPLGCLMKAMSLQHRKMDTQANKILLIILGHILTSKESKGSQTKHRFWNQTFES